MKRSPADGPCEVYGIRAGEHGLFHYVGMSHTAKGRWEAHERPTYETRGGNVVELLGDEARLVILSVCESRAKARLRERKWSHRLARWGHPLQNIEAVQGRADLAASKTCVEIALSHGVSIGLKMAALEAGVRAGQHLDAIIAAYLDDSSGVRAAVERWKAKHE